MSNQNGVVKFFNPNKGFGFIWISSAMMKQEKDRVKEEELFFHISGVLNSPSEEPIDLRSGDEVQFEVAEGNRGQSAINIVKTKSALEKNKTHLPATNLTIGIRKTYIPFLTDVFKDLLGHKSNTTDKSSDSREIEMEFNPNEREAMEEFYKTLVNASNRISIATQSTKSVMGKSNSEASKTNANNKKTPATV